MKRGAKFEFQIKRVYDPRSAEDGICFLVDRLWPRGVSKAKLSGVRWIKEVAPSPKLREWFGHEPAKWKEFQKRYRGELKASPAAWQPLLDAVRKDQVTLLYAAKDPEINHALVLKDFLSKKPRT